MARAPPPLPAIAHGHLGGGSFPPEVLVLLSDASALHRRLAMA